MKASRWLPVAVLLAATPGPPAQAGSGAAGKPAPRLFQPVRRPAVPRSSHASPIDAFIAHRLAAAGLRLSPEADPRTFIRRVTLDLVGLPPTPAEIADFVRDCRAAAPGGDVLPDAAVDRLVQRLLASPHFGERWARHWLDVARFSESDGFEEDQQRPHAWTYRDHVIRAFNEDRPYDRFVREQIAGDVLEPVTAEGIAATGFLVAGPWDAVQRVTPSRLGRLQSREEQLEEMVAAVGQTFLGLTLQCARCHDHKYDPIPQRDYYRIKAVFEGVDHGVKPRVHGTRPLLSAGAAAAREKASAPLRQRLASLEARAAQVDTQLGTTKENNDLASRLRAEQKGLRQEIETARKELQARFPVTPAFTGDRFEPGPTVVFARGDVKLPGDVVTPGGLSAIAHPGPDLGLDSRSPEAQRRLRFAAWLTHPDHPLTARVIVNRLWQYHFGTGLVDTPSDLGANGGQLSHPELLDWLAHDLVAHGWSLKRTHRLIVTSATYRQKSVADSPSDPLAREHARAARLDADCRLLWRFPPRRLEGEVVRDALLAMSGALTRQVGGPSYRPFTVTQLNTYFYHLFDRDEPDYNRRSVYRMSVITGRSPFLDALDCPSPAITTPRRRPSVTPLQALALMNDTFVVRQADQLARRINGEIQDPESQTRRAYEVVLGRPPRGPELAASAEVVRRHGLPTLCWTLFNASELLYLR